MMNTCRDYIVVAEEQGQVCGLLACFGINLGGLFARVDTPPNGHCQIRTALIGTSTIRQLFHEDNHWLMGMGGPLSSDHVRQSRTNGTYKTVKARFWPCLSGKSPENVFKVFPLRSAADGLLACGMFLAKPLYMA